MQIVRGVRVTLRAMRLLPIYARAVGRTVDHILGVRSVPKIHQSVVIAHAVGMKDLLPIGPGTNEGGRDQLVNQARLLSVKLREMDVSVPAPRLCWLQNSALQCVLSTVPAGYDPSNRTNTA